jgi:hypothetical protein
LSHTSHTEMEWQPASVAGVGNGEMVGRGSSVVVVVADGHGGALNVGAGEHAGQQLSNLRVTTVRSLNRDGRVS